MPCESGVYPVSPNRDWIITRFDRAFPCCDEVIRGNAEIAGGLLRQHEVARYDCTLIVHRGQRTDNRPGWRVIRNFQIADRNCHKPLRAASSSVRRAALARLCNPRFATQLLHLYGIRLYIARTASCQYSKTRHNGQLVLFDVFLTEGQTGRLVTTVAIDLAQPGHRQTRRTHSQHRGGTHAPKFTRSSGDLKSVPGVSQS